MRSAGSTSAVTVSLSSFLAKVNEDRFLREHSEPPSFQTAECLRLSVVGLKAFYSLYQYATAFCVFKRVTYIMVAMETIY